MAKIGIITILYKSDTVIEEFVACFNRQDYNDFEVIFVENDVESFFCEQYIHEHASFKYKFVRNESNLGVARGNNQGIEYFLPQENNEFLLFLNNDIVVEDYFLSSQVRLFRKYAAMDALAPKMYYHGTNNTIWYAGGSLSYLKEGPVHFGHNKKDKLVGEEVYEVNYAPTCSMMIRSSVMKSSEVKMWEQLFVYYDDYVFCKELYRAGVKLYYTPKIELQHKISTSTGGATSDFSRFYSTRNWTYLLKKYKNLTALLLPFYYVYNLLSGRKIENKGIIAGLKMA